MSLNEWPYVEGNPVNLTDPSGYIPRMPGICPNPPPGSETTNPHALGIIRRNDKYYVYCGEFKFTAYQFAVDKGYDNSITATTEFLKGYKPSAKFIYDVRLNGTGRSSDPKMIELCGGYFHKISFIKTYGDGLPEEFKFVCGRGKLFDPNIDASKIVAADLNRFELDDELYIPELDVCNGNGGCFNPYVTVRDEGGAIQGLRLDMFAGEGPGLNSSLYSTSDAAIWLHRTQFLGITTTFDGRQANGPTPAYEMVPEIYEDIYGVFYCRQFYPPHPGRRP